MLKTLICEVIDPSEAVILCISAYRGLLFTSRLPMQALLFFFKNTKRFWSVSNLSQQVALNTGTESICPFFLPISPEQSMH